jgi:Leucine-rich repeat (LRR) protein
MESSSSVAKDGYDSASDLLDMFFSDDFLADDEEETKEEITVTKSSDAVKVELSSGTKGGDKNVYSAPTTEDGKPPPSQVPGVKNLKGPDDRIAAKLAATRKTKKERGEDNKADRTESNSQAVIDFDSRIAAKLAASSQKPQRRSMETNNTKESVSSTAHPDESSQQGPGVQEVKNVDDRIAAKLATSRGIQKNDTTTTGSSNTLSSTSSQQGPGVQEVKNVDDRIAAKLATSRVMKRHPKESSNNNDREDKVAAKIASFGSSLAGLKSTDSARRIDERITAKLASNRMIVSRSDTTPFNPVRKGYFTNREENKSNHRLSADNSSRDGALEMDNRIVAKLTANSIRTVRSRESASSQSGSTSSLKDLDQLINSKQYSHLNSNNRSTSEEFPERNSYDQKIISILRGKSPYSNNEQEASSQERRPDLERPTIISTGNNISFRRRILDLSTPHNDDLVENVYGERIDLTSRARFSHLDETFVDHTFHSDDGNVGSNRNGSILTAAVNSENSRPNGLNVGTGNSSNYLSTISVDVEDVHHGHDLVNALQYSYVNSNNQQGPKQKEDEVSYFRLKTCLIFLIFAGIVAGIIAVSVIRRSPSPGTSPTTAPTSSRQIFYQDMYNFISSQDGVNATLLQNSSSPQAQALNWLVYNDGLELIPNGTEAIDHQIIQRYALMTTYFSVDSLHRDNLNWGAPTSECEWDGSIVCKKLEFQEKNIFSQVDSIVELRVDNVRLKGTLVNDTGLLSNLEHLDFHNNNINSPLPEYIFMLSRLEILDLRNNELKSPIDERIANLSNLRTLDLESCALIGSIPDSIIHSLSNLEKLGLSGNGLSGDIFPLILRLNKTIQYFDAATNYFNDSSIPTEIFSLTNLKILYLHENVINGFIPSEIGNLTSLDVLSLYSNKITGSLPSDIGNLGNLTNLYLENNDFFSVIPTQLGNLNNLERLVMSSNKFSGPIPTEIGKLEKLIHFRLDNNKLTAEIPDIFQNFSLLELLTLQRNDIIGKMPNSICDLREGSKLNVLESDCEDEMVCSCCTNCH